MLLKVYAKCIDGDRERINARIVAALCESMNADHKPQLPAPS